MPTEEDLAQTPETKWTQEIKALADSLKTPVKMQEYVRNNVDFEPYYGSPEVHLVHLIKCQEMIMIRHLYLYQC